MTNNITKNCCSGHSVATCRGVRWLCLLLALLLLAGFPALTIHGQSAPPAPPSYTVTTLVADGKLLQPSAIALDSAGNAYIADPGNNVIRKLDSAGNLTIFAGVQGCGEKYSQQPKRPQGPEAAGQCHSTTGDWCSANKAILSAPKNIALDAQGNVYVSDFSASKIRRVDAATSVVTVYAGGPAGGWSATQLKNPEGIAFDAQGNLYIADRSNNAIRKVAAPASLGAKGAMTTIAGLGPSRPGCAADGVAAQTAPLRSPGEVAVDGAGNIYIADTGCRKIREITTDGILHTVVGSGKGRTGNPVHVPYNGPSANALQVNLSIPVGVKADAAGNLYISDAGARVVWRYDVASQTVSVIGGAGPDPSASPTCAGAASALGDGCLASQVKLNVPYRVAIDAQGNVYVPEHGESAAPARPFAIRILQPAASSGQ
jgi:sugar lactone lactonase YvrE